MPNEKQPVILIIDDEEPVRKSFRNFLEDCNYAVLEAENGRVGLEIFEREKPDLLLIDLRMPEIDGLEVLWKVVERSPETPAIVISGAGDIEDVIEALHLGAWDYLRKPIEDISVLRHTVEKSMDRARLIRENLVYQERLEHKLIEKGEDIERTHKELHKRTRALKKSEEKFRTLIETSSDWIWEVDLDGTFIFASPRVKDLLGFDVDEIVGTTLFDNMPDQDLERTKAFFKEKCAHPKPFSGWKIALLYKDGQQIIMEINGTPIFDRHGSLSGWFGFNKDITDRVLAENSLRESRQLYRDLVETINDLIWEVDAKGSYTYLSPRTMEIFGYSHEELLGKSFWGTMSPEEKSRVRTLFKGLSEDPRPFDSLEAYVIHKNGHKVIADNNGKPFFDSDGTLIGFRGVSRDITERYQAREALKESEEKFRSFMETASDLMHITDQDGTLIYVNEAMARTLKYSKEELIGMNIKELLSEKILKTTFKPETKELFISGEISPETLWVSKHGKEVYGEIKVSAIYDKDGTFAGTRGLFRDLTDQKKAEDAKERLQTKLQQAQKLEAMGTLAGGIAHDFNNLLMGIQGRVSLMLIDSESPANHFEHLKGIENYVHSAADLTRQLLGFARGGKYEVKTSDLNELIKEQNRMFGRTNKGIAIRGKYEKDLWPVDVDQGQIQQVILNLYVNAAHAMPNGGALNIQTEKISLDETYPKPFEVKPGRYVKISITDTGIGMDEDTIGRIFDPFFTTKEMGRGTGLGLASVYGIIKNHGGFITVYSEKGIGTTFNVYLPVSERTIREEDKPSGEVVKGKGTVLLVDDEEMIIDVAGQMIQNFGYHVITAASGKEALDVYKKNKDRIDMVILDMIMPEMSGEDAYDNLKEIDPEIKVLLSSGYSIDGRAAKILERGCDGFIQKPFDMKRLSNKIVEVLDRE